MTVSTSSSSAAASALSNPSLLPPRHSSSSSNHRNIRIHQTLAKQQQEQQQLKPFNTKWLYQEVLKRTDVANGNVCLFHYPIPLTSTPQQVPFVTVDIMQCAFDKLAAADTGTETSTTSNNAHNNGSENNNNEEKEEELEYLTRRATIESRHRITRIQFCWYQFRQFPRVIHAYANIQHVDIRQNASLTSIDSIIAQLPNLSSLNLSDCPNVRTLSPLASVLFSEDDATITSAAIFNNNENNHRNNESRRRTLALKHLWVRGSDLANMSDHEWTNVFEALAESDGPFTRLTLSRNNLTYLHPSIGKLTSLTYLFLEDNVVDATCTGSSAIYADDTSCNKIANNNSGFIIPEEVGQLQSLRFASFCGNNITRLPQQMAHLNINCDVYLHRNPNLRYPPPPYQKNIKLMREFFHNERMALLRGTVLLMPHVTRARSRALERLYQPGGLGYFEAKANFEEIARGINNFN